MRSLSLSARMIIASAVLAVLVAGVFAILIRAMSSLDDATRREEHAKDVTAATLRLEKLVIDLETGVSGFILTRNEAVLKPWKDARAALPGQLANFQDLASTNPEQTQLARELAVTIDDYVQEYSVPVVNIARTNPVAAQDSVAREEGQFRTGEIRDRFTRFLAAENALASASAASANRQADRAIALATMGLIGSALLIGLFALSRVRSTAGPVRSVGTAASR